jgi:hypothetical protein
MEDSETRYVASNYMHGLVRVYLEARANLRRIRGFNQETDPRSG